MAEQHEMLRRYPDRTIFVENIMENADLELTCHVSSRHTQRHPPLAKLGSDVPVNIIHDQPSREYAMSTDPKRDELKNEACRTYLFDMLAQMAVLAQSVDEAKVAHVLIGLVKDKRYGEGHEYPPEPS